MLSNPAFWALYSLAFVLILALPVIIGLIRRVDHIGLVIAFSLLGIPTALAGWVVAMLFACLWSSRLKPRPVPETDPALRPSSGEYDPGPMRGTPFESLARSGFWAEHQSNVGRSGH